MKKETPYPPLVPGKMFHVYNHAAGKDVLFKGDGNFTFFLSLYKRHIHAVCHTYCWCLMPNHFHFVVRIKGVKEIAAVVKKMIAMPYYAEGKNILLKKIIAADTLNQEEELYKLILLFTSKSFSNLFSAYTQAYNKQQNRKGVLVQNTFNRKEIDNIGYFINLIHYIHYNPVQHGFVKKPNEWNYSSYHAIVSNKQTLVKKSAVLKAFGSLPEFLNAHEQPPNYQVDYD
jgi:putative transposase